MKRKIKERKACKLLILKENLKKMMPKVVKEGRMMIKVELNLKEKTMVKKI